jgi:hypothetical protein
MPATGRREMAGIPTETLINPSLGPIGALVVFAIAAVGAFLGAYLAQKGKNLATHADIDRLVRATEEIKSQISGTLWIRQQRWDLQREVYVRLLEALGDVSFRLSTLKQLARLEQEGDPTAIKPAVGAIIREHFDRLADSIAVLRRSMWLATAVLPPTPLERLNTMLATWRPAPESAARDTIAGFYDHVILQCGIAGEAISQAAREDLVELPTASAEWRGEQHGQAR